MCLRLSWAAREEKVVSKRASCGVCAGAPKLVPFRFFFRSNGKEKTFRQIFGSGIKNGKQIGFRLCFFGKILAQDGKFLVTGTEPQSVFAFGPELQLPEQK